jgi:uncharacterized protein (DUF952 family)
MLIFKICHDVEWREATLRGIYGGTDKDRRDGFLHFSTEPQLLGTLQKWYAAATDLVLVAVDADFLGSDLKWEAARDGALFPHLYGSLPAAAAIWVAPIGRDASGRFILPTAAMHNPVMPA